MERLKTCFFGAGCFWGVQYIFERIPGVLETQAGYMGGELENPTYEQVCTGKTGHAEVLKIRYDSSKIKYEKLLEVFFKCHNPTTLNQQGPDYGKQYRSVVFYTDSVQKGSAEKFKLAYQRELGKRIVTEITHSSIFYPAEEHHQDYYDKTGGKPYCHVMPKIEL